MPSPNLGITEVSASQDDKVPTINEARNRLELALTNFLIKGVTSPTTVLDTSEADEALGNIYYRFTGTPGGAVDVEVPDNTKLYICHNAVTDGSIVTVTTSGGSGVALDPGDIRALYCDGADVVEVETGTVAQGRDTLLFGHNAAHSGAPPATLQLEMVDGVTTVDSNTGYRAIRAGSVVGVSVQLNVSAFTAGDTIDVEVRVGATTTLTAQIAAPGGTGFFGAQATAARGVHAVAAGNVIGARLTFGGSANFTIEDISVVVEVAS